jgi:hypothetical protein
MAQQIVMFMKSRFADFVVITAAAYSAFPYGVANEQSISAINKSLKIYKLQQLYR